VTFSDLSDFHMPNSKLLVGKTRNWCNGRTPSGGNRLVSNYSLYSEAFTHSRITGLQLLNDFDEGRINWNIALFNGYPISATNRLLGVEYWGAAVGTANVSHGNSINVLALGEASLDNNDTPAISTRFGGDVTDHFNIGVSGYISKLTVDDQAVLAGLGLGNIKAKHYHYGLDFKYKVGRFVWQTEASDADMGGLDFWGMQTLVGMDVTPSDHVYLQYGMLEYDVTPVAGTSALWDKQQLTLSYKHNLSPRAWLTLEREWNFEDPPAGTAEVDNDLTFLEYMVVY